MGNYKTEQRNGDPGSLERIRTAENEYWHMLRVPGRGQDDNHTKTILGKQHDEQIAMTWILGIAMRSMKV